MNNETNTPTESTLSNAVPYSDLKPQPSLRDLHQLAESVPTFHNQIRPLDTDIGDNDIDETGLDESLEETKSAYLRSNAEAKKAFREDRIHIDSEELNFHEQYLEEKIKEYLIRLGLNIDSNQLGILSDSEILDLCVDSKMITPYKDKQIRSDHRGKIISYGLSSAGYDTTMAYEVKVPKLLRGPDGALLPVDPKATSEADWDTITIDKNQPVPQYVVNPGEHILSYTPNYFRMPNDVMAICLGKSTYARVGVIINVTPLEPGWEGNVTLEIHNSSCRPVIIYPGEGICQFIFFRIKRPKTTYADRKGKYQGQRGITLSKV